MFGNCWCSLARDKYTLPWHDWRHENAGGSEADCHTRPCHRTRRKTAAAVAKTSVTSAVPAVVVDSARLEGVRNYCTAAADLAGHRSWVEVVIDGSAAFRAVMPKFVLAFAESVRSWALPSLYHFP